LYSQYYQEYENYLKQKQTSSITGAIFGGSTALTVLGVGVLAFLLLTGERGD